MSAGTLAPEIGGVKLSCASNPMRVLIRLTAPPFGFQTLGWMLLIGLLGSIVQIVISQSFKELIPQLSSRQAVHPSPPTALGIISID